MLVEMPSLAAVWTKDSWLTASRLGLAPRIACRKADVGATSI